MKKINLYQASARSLGFNAGHPYNPCRRVGTLGQYNPNTGEFLFSGTEGGSSCHLLVEATSIKEAILKVRASEDNQFAEEWFCYWKKRIENILNGSREWDTIHPCNKKVRIDKDMRVDGVQAASLEEATWLALEKSIT